jgi:1,4-alpha-glucan branching enzyme
MYALAQSPSTATAALGPFLLPDKSSISFRVWAPNASSVLIFVGPPGATPPNSFALASDPAAGIGYWSGVVSGVSVGDQYYFSITNNGIGKYNPGGPAFFKTDPCARAVESSDPWVPSLINDTDYDFSPFATPAFEDLIIYQSHVGSFSGRNDGLPTTLDAQGWTSTFANFKAKLGYIKSMNFNAVQFLPNGEYDRGVDNGEAYNPSNYYAPETLYGQPQDLRDLIEACHQEGLAVIFDVVYNHMDSSHNLWQFDLNDDQRTDESNATTGGGIYFSTVDTGFGRRPNHDSPDVQRFFIANAAMWFDEYKVDGLRFDSAVNFSQGGLKAIVSSLLASYPSKFIYAEDSDTAYIFGTIGFPACWDMNSADGYARMIASRNFGALQGMIERFGYPTAWSAIRYLLGSHDQIYNDWEYDDASRKGYWAKPGGGDLIENRYFVEKIGGVGTGRSNWYALAQARMGWALNVAMPCTPMMFMGTECHHYGYWDPETDVYGDHRFDWSIAGDTTGMPMRQLVADVNQVRWNNPALRTDFGPEFPHIDSDNSVLAFRRWDNSGNVILVVVNLSDNQWNDAIYGVTTGAPGEGWEEIFNSQSPQYGGWNDSGNYLAQLWVQGDGKFYIRLPKWSVLIFRKTS